MGAVYGARAKVELLPSAAGLSLLTKIQPWRSYYGLVGGEKRTMKHLPCMLREREIGWRSLGFLVVLGMERR